MEKPKSEDKLKTLRATAEVEKAVFKPKRNKREHDPLYCCTEDKLGCGQADLV